jgi:hypothetical protein
LGRLTEALKSTVVRIEGWSFDAGRGIETSAPAVWPFVAFRSAIPPGIHTRMSVRQTENAFCRGRNIRLGQMDGIEFAVELHGQAEFPNENCIYPGNGYE